jgi:hypothetical protein
MFSQIIAFSQSELAFTHNFLCDYAQDMFIHNKADLGATIFGHQTLGPHADIVWFQGGAEFRFFWAHPKLRPHGKTPPAMCNACKCFMPWIDTDAEKRKSGQIQDDSIPIVHQCQYCELILRYPFPDGAKWVRDHGYDGADKGSWLYLQK